MKNKKGIGVIGIIGLILLCLIGISFIWPFFIYPKYNIPETAKPCLWDLCESECEALGYYGDTVRYLGEPYYLCRTTQYTNDPNIVKHKYFFTEQEILNCGGSVR